MRYILKVNHQEIITCQRCGTCCLADMIAYVTKEDMDRWINQSRSDILHIIENEQAFWAGDHLVSARDGRPLMGCPFLAWEKGGYGCSIYETRPGVCEKYEPGSSQICPLWKA